MPRSAMFRSLVIFACLGHVLGESDPSCWLQSRPTGTGQDSAIRSRPGTDLDLLGSKSTSTLARLNELRARMKEEAPQGGQGDQRHGNHGTIEACRSSGVQRFNRTGREDQRHESRVEESQKDSALPLLQLAAYLVIAY